MNRRNPKKALAFKLLRKNRRGHYVGPWAGNYRWYTDRWHHVTGKLRRCSNAIHALYSADDIREWATGRPDVKLFVIELKEVKGGCPTREYDRKLWARSGKIVGRVRVEMRRDALTGAIFNIPDVVASAKLTIERIAKRKRYKSHKVFV